MAHTAQGRASPLPSGFPPPRRGYSRRGPARLGGPFAEGGRPPAARFSVPSPVPAPPSRSRPRVPARAPQASAAGTGAVRGRCGDGAGGAVARSGPRSAAAGDGQQLLLLLLPLSRGGLGRGSRGALRCPALPCPTLPCRPACAMDWQVLTRELSLYLESQVRVGLFGSGVGLSLVLGFGVAYACYYLSSIAKKPQLVASNDRFCRFLEEYCPVVTETYYPTIWCWEGRVQTLLRPFITSRPQVQYRNELIKTADGGQISLDWFDNNDSLYYPDASTRPTVLLLPGLTGTSKESYILHMIHQSETLGYRCVVFNNRGIAGEELLTPRTYCAANTEDLEAVIHHVHSLHPSAPFMAAGVSMGGHRQMLEKLFDMDLVMKARTVREFDKQFTSVMFGYRTIDDYYEDASPCRKLKSVGIPVLCLNSVDDVFSPGHAIPVEAAKQNANVALVLTSCGGHIGFLEGIWPRKCTYMDRVFKQFVQAIFEHGNKFFSM
ncbi:phospholipase ABHD3 isoform X2 [Balearica regulorum gibbericeps]|uniref:phospholipase ABHD3 isoform X2 n=1 Tax=Balearica regulorum gibbericeps TaxID=100784 RepID=UPI003F6451AA